MMDIGADLSIMEQILLALCFGWLLGYERYFHGRVGGTQVYCLICMAACALTAASDKSSNVVGNILTGIGFLGAGFIAHSGTTVRGLTTAASVWSSSVIGILIGLGHYFTAAGLTAFLMLCTVVIPTLEARIPARISLAVSLRYREGHHPQEDSVVKFLESHDLSMPADSISINFDNRFYSLHFLIMVGSHSRSKIVSKLTHELPKIAYVESFSIERAGRG